MDIQNKKWVIILPLIFAILFVAGMFLGGRLKSNSDQYYIYQNPDKLNTILDYIVNEYVDPVSKEDLIEHSIPYILKNLDPHSVYIPAEELQAVNEPLEGEFDGIGVQFNIMNDTIVVVATITGGPAELLGMLPGDRIVTISDSVFVGKKISSDDVMKKLRGKSGTIVRIGVKRAGVDGLIDFEITRGKIPLYSVDVSYMIDKEIGYIKISKFSKTTYEEFISAVEKLKSNGLQKLVVDLRANGGGYMDGAVNIADEFLDEDRLIVYTQGNSRAKSSIFATSEGRCEDMPVAILIDEWSASASEILAGAIQDNDRGIIVGRRSFGKGLIQEPIVFNDGSAMRLTIARYYSPTGRCIQRPYEKGIEEYYNVIGHRILDDINGDTTQIHDSVFFLTPAGKKVYGGGGINPDFFVKIDTSGYSDYLSKITSRGLIYKFAFKFVDENRNILARFTKASEIDQYLKSIDIREKFLLFSEAEGINYLTEDIRQSGKIIDAQIKAYIARNLIDNDGYYPFIRPIDNVLNTAIEILSKKED